jgi:hypothetical protein
MSKETDFKFRSATVKADEGIHAGFDLSSGDWQATQDITQYKEQAKMDRDRQAYFGHKKGGYRKMATIPDIVAIKILQEHHLDLHDPGFMNDPNNMKRLRTILQTKYRDLLVNT